MQQPMPGGGGGGAGAAGIYNTDINHKGHRDYVSVLYVSGSTILVPYDFITLFVASDIKKQKE